MLSQNKTCSLEALPYKDYLGTGNTCRDAFIHTWASKHSHTHFNCMWRNILHNIACRAPSAPTAVKNKGDKFLKLIFMSKSCTHTQTELCHAHTRLCHSWVESHQNTHAHVWEQARPITTQAWKHSQGFIFIFMEKPDFSTPSHGHIHRAAHHKVSLQSATKESCLPRQTSI